MTLDAQATNHIETLKVLLQEKTRARDFETLVAALVSKMLDVPIFVAKSGFQYGGDSGPAGQLGRNFRIECKKYDDITPLKERELLGEIDQALARDGALEAWILAVTRSVPEQLAQTLEMHGDQLGVPVLVIDWTGPGIPPLAALCASSVEIVEQVFSKAAAQATMAFAAVAEDAISQLKRRFEAWCIGFKSLQEAAHRNIQEIWNSPTLSHAILNQDVAGGANPKKVRRQKVSNGLTQWWNDSATDAPAILVGYDGVGKTWALLDWLIDNITRLPIVIVLPSSAMADIGAPSETAVLSVLGARLTEITKVRDGAHWTRRLRILLQRPSAESPR